MRMLLGTKREINIFLWKEQLQKYIKRIDDDMKCFEKFEDEDSINFLIEDCDELRKIAEHIKNSI